MTSLARRPIVWMSQPSKPYCLPPLMVMPLPAKRRMVLAAMRQCSLSLIVMPLKRARSKTMPSTRTCDTFCMAIIGTDRSPISMVAMAGSDGGQK